MTAPRPWHLLAPGQTPPRGAVTFPLIRRGVDHGTVVLGVVEPTPPADPDAAFDRDEPVLIPGVLGDALEDVDEQVAATWVAFDAFRAGARLLAHRPLPAPRGRLQRLPREGSERRRRLRASSGSRDAGACSPVPWAGSAVLWTGSAMPRAC